MTYPPPLFIVGCKRSGTTMLRLMFAAHPDVCVPPESMFFVQMEDAFGKGLPDTSKVDTFVAHLYENEKFCEWGVDRSTLRGRLSTLVPCTYAEAVSAVYRTYCEDVDSEAIRWGDKNPEYVRELPRIFEHYPDAHVIHLVRDVRAVYNSHKSKKVIENWDYLNPDRLLHTVSHEWQRCGKVYQEYAHDDRVNTIFYEDLVTDLESVLRTLCEAIDLSFEPEMLDFYEKNREEQLVPSHRREWHEKTFQPVDPQRAVAWKDKLSDAEVQALEIINQDPLSRFDYSFLSASPRLLGRLLLFTNYVSNSLSYYASTFTRRLGR